MNNKSRRIVILAAALSILTGCTTNLINKDGQVVSCVYFSDDRPDMASAARNHEQCITSAKKAGYHRFDAANTVTGIFLNEKFTPFQGANIGYVVPGSPADCSGIRSGGKDYLFMVNNEVVENMDHGHDLLDFESSETLQVVIRNHHGAAKDYTIWKAKAGAAPGCRDNPKPE